MDTKSQKELEMPAKVYQVDALHNELVGIKNILQEQNGLLKGTVTISYLQEQIKNLEDRVSAKYDPTLANTRWVAKTAISAFISIILVVIGIYLKS